MKPVYLIGIAGGSGSGKTTFLRALLAHFNSQQVALVSQDNYYFPKELQQKDNNGWINYDLPTSIDRKHFYDDIMKLSTGQPVQKLEYNFNNPEWEPEHITVHPAPVIIAEGLFVFHYQEIMERLDYKVFLDAHHEERLNRRIQRDGSERGYPEHEVLYQWHNHVRPAEEQFLQPYYSECELIVDNTHSFDDGLNQLVNRIIEVLKNDH